jgi:hypothetical protein
MNTRPLGRWLLVALALLAVAFAVPAVSAHGAESTQTNATATAHTPADGDAAAWAAWMEGQMTDHMGPGAVAEMEAHMGVTVEEMAQAMGDRGHTAGGPAGQGAGC